MSESSAPNTGGREPRDEWSRLAPLITAILDATPDQRTGLLDELCGHDAALRARVAELVAECERPDTLLDRSAAACFGELFSGEDEAFPASLAERYPGATVIGRGGMAVVYRAHDVKHGRDVAIKVMQRGLSAALGRDRFLREIQIAATLRHPHIVPLYDSGEADGLLYFVMPYEEGQTLRQCIANSQLPLRRAIAIFRDIVEALDYAHRHGVVHRDIKPENVLLSGEHALVTDFGVARALERSPTDPTTTAGITLGTPAYMSPEQIAADPSIDHRSDIYSAGLVAYEMLAGRPPFRDVEIVEALAARLTRAPDPLARYRPDVPAALESLIAKCLERRPEDRWQRASAILAQLESMETTGQGRPLARSLSRGRLLGVAGGVLGVVAFATWASLGSRGSSWRNPLDNARVERITDFAGSEVDAAISADGKFVAFLADTGGRFDAFVTQLGSGQFRNLTNGLVPELYNEDVRNIGFTGDASHVWLRTGRIAAPDRVSLVPTMGGPMRAFLDHAVTAAWSPDGQRIAYHETGDPIFIADRSGRSPRLIFPSGAGEHAHFPHWSPDGRYVYFVRGVPPSELDVWRVPADSGAPERMTHHNAFVAHPLLLDDRTLLYVASDDDGTGPWLYAMDVTERIARRVTTGIERYLSVSAAGQVAGQRRRLVATVSNPVVNLWSAPLTSQVVDERGVTPLDVPTVRAGGPRFAPDGSLYYLASRTGADGLWRIRDGVATEFWGADGGAVVGAAAVSPDGQTVCAPVRREHRSRLYCSAADGTGARVISGDLDVRGAGSWSPDGRWLAIAAQDSVGVRVYKVPATGGPAVVLVAAVSSNPVWSPSGDVILYAATPRARTARVMAVTPDGRDHPIPLIDVDRLGDSYRFLPNGTQLVIKQGGFRRQDFFLLDLATGDRRRLTQLRSGEALSRFDLSPDGKRIVFGRVRENSDIALIELAR